MPKFSLSSGSIITADVRREFRDIAASDRVYFVIRASHSGPLELSFLLKNGIHVIRSRKRSTDGAFAIPLPENTAAGDILTWSLIAFFDLPEVGAYTYVGEFLNFLDAKRTETEAGTAWTSSKELEDRHVDP